MRAVLTYHSIDPSGSAVSVDEADFRAHVHWLASGVVPVLPLPELMAGGPDANDAVAITFDDAIESFGTIAAPLLLDAGLPVTVFVVSDRIGLTNRWPGEPASHGVPEMPLLGWDDLARLAGRGVDIGAHTRTHADLTRLSPEQVADEVGGSAEDIERNLGIRARSFAYPYGAHDDTAVAAARRCYELACTTRLDVLADRTDPHRVPRLDMVYYRDPRRLAAWGSPSFDRYLAMRKAGRRVGSALRSLAARA